METLIKELGEIAIHNFKAIDPESLEGTSNPLYDPVKYRIAGVSNLVSCIVSTGCWAASTLNVSGATAISGNVMAIDLGSAWGNLLMNSINVHCQSILTTDLGNKISKSAILSGNSELAFIRRHNIESEFGIIVDIANKIFLNKGYQTEVELTADSESEGWETLLFRFYLDVTIDEFMKYQDELVKQFVSKIEPSKRTYFSVIIEPK
jgi:hypothetical protein